MSGEAIWLGKRLNQTTASKSSAERLMVFLGILNGIYPCFHPQHPFLEEHMTTQDLLRLPSFMSAVVCEKREITGVYCTDLLSWAMANLPAGGAWCTVMGNINAVAVGYLADAAVIVLCEGAELADDARQKAAQQGVTIVTTQLPVFKAGLAIAKAAGLEGLA